MKYIKKYILLFPGMLVHREISCVTQLTVGVEGICIIVSLHNEVVGGGILVSLRPSVRLSHTPCPLCSAYSSDWIHFLLIHLIKQLQKVCYVQVFFFLNFLQFFKICSFDFVLFWLRIWCESPVWVIMGRLGVSQNAGILVVLIQFIFVILSEKSSVIITVYSLRYGCPDRVYYIIQHGTYCCKHHRMGQV